uniref:Lipocalin-like domain-containing protein n=1 Tax=Solibacter usitatus (strain Ellin6076) TaxID=234267 RepID=Q020F6_SOLUE
MRAAAIFVSLTVLTIIGCGAEPDPFFGKWKLNWEKSQSTQSRPRSAIRSYHPSGSGVRVRETWVDANGQKRLLDYVAGYDGRDYPVRTKSGATVSFKRPDLYTVEGVSKTLGKIEYTFRRFISKDGKTLTVALTRMDPAGAPSTEMLVYDKVK